MRRLDWQLVRPSKEAGDLSESLSMAEMIHRLVWREARGKLDQDDAALLDEVEATYLGGTRSSCDVVGAPYVGDDPHWESRLLDEYDQSDVDLELEEYLELRRAEPDCERCPYASPYSLYPMDPCEFSAGLLEDILAERDLQEQATRPMTPTTMRAYADGLEAALREGRWRRIETVDAEDYLAKAVHFLRFWADHGFGLLPTDIDDVVDFQEADGPAAPPSDESEPTTFH